MNTENTSKLNKHLRLFFTVLLFGGLWGIAEATLGSFLHLPLLDAAGMYACSTTIMVPIAFYLMAACYKKSGNIRSMLYMGVMAGGIKALACLIFDMSFNPVYYILLESLAMAGAVLVIRPKKVLSFNGLATMIIASSVYLFAAELFKLPNLTMSAWVADVEKRVFMFNAVAILYTFASGAAMYGVTKLVEVKKWNFDSVKKIVFSPITASVVAAVMVTTTMLFMGLGL